MRLHKVVHELETLLVETQHPEARREALETALICVMREQMRQARVNQRVDAVLDTNPDS